MDSFNTDQSVNTEQPTDQLTFKVGEREYDAQAAATKIAAQDDHINKIQLENQDYGTKLAAAEAQIASSTKIDEALAKLQQQQAPQESLTIPQTSAMSEEQIGEIAKSQLTSFMQKQQEEQSAQQAQALADLTYKETATALQTQFGDKVDEAITAYAQSTGVTVDSLHLAARDPSTSKLLLAALKVNSPKTETAPSQGHTSFYEQQDDGTTGIDWKGGKATSKDIMAKLREGQPTR